MDYKAMREIGTWLTVSEAARKIGISRQALYPYLYDGRLRAVETRAGWLVEPAAVDRMARERRNPDDEGWADVDAVIDHG